MIVLYWILGYFVVGLVSLGIIELTTRRFSRNFSKSTIDAQTKLANNGTPSGNTETKVLLLGATILFWPFAVYGMLTPNGGKRGKEPKETSGEAGQAGRDDGQELPHEQS